MKARKKILSFGFGFFLKTGIFKNQRFLKCQARLLVRREYKTQCLQLILVKFLSLKNKNEMLPIKGREGELPKNVPDFPSAMPTLIRN